MFLACLFLKLIFIRNWKQCLLALSWTAIKQQKKALPRGKLTKKTEPADEKKWRKEK